MKYFLESYKYFSVCVQVGGGDLVGRCCVLHPRDLRLRGQHGLAHQVGGYTELRLTDSNLINVMKLAYGITLILISGPDSISPSCLGEDHNHKVVIAMNKCTQLKTAFTLSENNFHPFISFYSKSLKIILHDSQLQ